MSLILCRDCGGHGYYEYHVPSWEGYDLIHGVCESCKGDGLEEFFACPHCDELAQEDGGEIGEIKWYSHRGYECDLDSSHRFESLEGVA